MKTLDRLARHEGRKESEERGSRAGMESNTNAREEKPSRRAAGVVIKLSGYITSAWRGGAWRGGAPHRVRPSHSGGSAEPIQLGLD